VINFVRALGAATAATSLGPRIRTDDAWLAAPDFTIAVGPLAPGALRDYRGRRIVLLVVYTLPGSRERMTALARSYELLSVLGVEIVAVPARVTGHPIVELGAAPPVLFPVVTDGTAAIVATYGLFAPGPHAEVLIDRQGYVRAVWRNDASPADTSVVQAEVERLNAEKSPPPFPDDHVH
jgi:peroxiredoxin